MVVLSGNERHDRVRQLISILRRLSIEAEGFAELADICVDNDFKSLSLDGILNQIDLNYRRRIKIAKRLKGIIQAKDLKVFQLLLRDYHINPAHV